jgi:hypothetical protein
MPNGLQLRNFRQQRRVSAQQMLWQVTQGLFIRAVDSLGAGAPGLDAQFEYGSTLLTLILRVQLV